jgi:hypothetical protein
VEVVGVEEESCPERAVQVVHLALYLLRGLVEVLVVGVLVAVGVLAGQAGQEATLEDRLLVALPQIFVRVAEVGGGKRGALLGLTQVAQAVKRF